jgi:hypothetical protein
MSFSPTTLSAGHGFLPPVRATRGQTFVGVLMASLLIAGFLASASVVIGCLGSASCQDGAAIARTSTLLPGYGVRS